MPNLYFVHPDHLNRPIKMTDSTEAIVWDAVYRPFGDAFSISGTAANNLRFPGQYFLIEDGLHYNWHRHYDPTIGRYMSSDPLEFVDGSSLYSYVHGNPLGSRDPSGLSGDDGPGSKYGPPCSGKNSDCKSTTDEGTRGTFPDPTQPGCFLCLDCYLKTFGEKP
jgi:RHS repeat-associated protein